MSVFADSNISVEVAAELMDVVGITYDDLSDPYVYKRFKDVAKFYGDSKDIKRDVLKLMKSNVTDPLGHVWAYTQLNQRFADEVKSLSQYEELDKGIYETIADGYITAEQIKRIKKDLKKPNTLKDAEKKQKLEKTLSTVEELKKEVNAYE